MAETCFVEINGAEELFLTLTMKIADEIVLVEHDFGIRIILRDVRHY
jgi:hypothetical protein